MINENNFYENVKHIENHIQNLTSIHVHDIAEIMSLLQKNDNQAHNIKQLQEEVDLLKAAKVRQDESVSELLKQNQILRVENDEMRKKIKEDAKKKEQEQKIKKTNSGLRGFIYDKLFGR